MHIIIIIILDEGEKTTTILYYAHLRVYVRIISIYVHYFLRTSPEI